MNPRQVWPDLVGFGPGFPLHCAAAFAACGFALAAFAEDVNVEQPYFGIQVVDQETGRGVPLVELRTVSEAVYVTDSGGWAAVAEPDLAGREVFFHVSGPGYEAENDGFGFRGRRLKVVPGQTATIKLNRLNIAERMYRVTGQGVYRDTELLGLKPPLELPQRGAGVLGQDSVQAVPYRGKIFWLWGDTNLANYPLGNFHTTCATSPVPGTDDFSPEKGVPLEYFFVNEPNDRVRKMMPMEEPGVVWIFGLFNIADSEGKETLVGHYARLKGLGNMLEQGLAKFDDGAGIFQRLKQLPLEEKWRFPHGNAVTLADDDGEYVYFCEPFANVRVAAKWESIIDPGQYEALAWDATAGEYRWQHAAPPTTQDDERKLIERGKLPREKARYELTDAESDKSVPIHRASIEFNNFRQKWIMIGNQEGDRDAPSYLGEVWYAEADSITGPWSNAVKIATHPKYSFYNPRQHPFMASEDGRVIYFEGTYTRMFSASPTPTPRYDYNQLLYRLDVGDERLTAGARIEVSLEFDAYDGVELRPTVPTGNFAVKGVKRSLSRGSSGGGARLMGGAFDPYHRWLGISPKEQPPNHYRLLGLERFESDHDVIDEAADRQMAHVRTHQSGQYAEQSQRLLNEISTARRCLLNDVTRHEYDAQLRSREPQTKTAVPLAVKPLPVAQPLPAAPVAKAALVEESSIPSPSIITVDPAVNTAPKMAGRYGPRRAKGNPLLPLLIVAGGAGALLLIAVAVVASGMLFADPEPVVARNETPAFRSAGGASQRNSSGANPLPQPQRSNNTPPRDIRSVGDIGGATNPANPSDDNTTNTNTGGSSFPTLGETALSEAKLHPEPRGPGVTPQDISQQRCDEVVAGVENSVGTLQLPDGQGTACFVVDKRGWVVTNYRFLAGSASATVGFGRFESRRVEGVIAANPHCDLVLLDVGTLPEDVTVARLADVPWHKREIALTISTPAPGSHYVMIGQSYRPLTGGAARELIASHEGVDLFTRRGYGEETNWVETSRNGNDGRFGGPLFDTQSRVVGVTTWSSTPEANVGCAVSVVEIHELLRRANGQTYPLSALDGKTQLPPPAP